eukprot:403341323
MNNINSNQEQAPHVYSIKRTKALGKLVKSEMEKLKQLKKIKKSKEQEKREVLRSLESILENTLDLLNLEDAQAFLTRKMKELNIDIEEQTQNQFVGGDQHHHNVLSDVHQQVSNDVVPQQVNEEEKLNDHEPQTEIPDTEVDPKGQWEKIGEKFSEVSISYDNQIWAVGSQQIGYGGNAIYTYLNNKWVQVQGEAIRIAAYKAGELWAVNQLGRVWQYQNSEWVMRADSGTASDIAVGEDGSVWITCSHAMKEKGINLMYYDFANSKFVMTNGFGSEISVGRNGEPVIILENGEIVLKKGRDMQKINGYAKDVAVTKNDEIWIVSEEKVSGGFQVFKGLVNDQVQWEDMNIAGVRIAALDDKNALVVNEWGEVYRYRK